MQTNDHFSVLINLLKCLNFPLVLNDTFYTISIDLSFFQ